MSTSSEQSSLGDGHRTSNGGCLRLLCHLGPEGLQEGFFTCEMVTSTPKFYLGYEISVGHHVVKSLTTILAYG